MIKENKIISYEELSNKIGDIVMMNNIYHVADDLELENGDEEIGEVYQTYAITKKGAEYLKDNTNELVYYSDKLDSYFWGITHFGTSWSIVFTELIDKKQDKDIKNARRFYN